MHGNSKAVVFIGCGYPFGGVLFLAHMGAAISKITACEPFDFYFAAIDDAMQEGYWEIVRRDISTDRILHAPTFAELSNAIVGLAECYSKVLVHTAGGWGQTRHISLARQRMSSESAHRIVLVGTTHSYRNDSILRIPMSLLQCWMYRRYYRAVIFQCQNAADRFCGGSRLIKSGRGEIIPLGCEEFSQEALHAPLHGLSDAVVDALNDSSLFKFVYLAAFRPGKMHVWMISAIAPVLKAYPNVRLILCGAGRSDVIEAVDSCIEKNGLDGQVLRAGLVARANIPSVLGHCNCAVVASRSETFGHNYLEPMFAGIPVLGTAVGVGADIVQDGKTGFRISLNDPAGFRKVAATVIEDSALTKRMGRNAYALVRCGYRHEDVARQHVALYERLLKEE